MLFLPPGTSQLLRIHGAFVSEAEIKRLRESFSTAAMPVYDASIFAVTTEESAEPEPFDDKYDEAVALVARGQASALAVMQRHLRIGYNRAALAARRSWSAKGGRSALTAAGRARSISGDPRPPRYRTAAGCGVMGTVIAMPALGRRRAAIGWRGGALAPAAPAGLPVVGDRGRR